MRRNFIIGICVVACALFTGATIASAITILPVQQGGTGWGYPGNITPGAILFGDYGGQHLATSSALTFSTSTSDFSTTYASTTGTSATFFCLTGDTCRTTWPTAGAAFPFTPTANYNSTSTVIGFLDGVFSSASSTLNGGLNVGSLSGFIGGNNGLLYSFATSSIKTSQLTNDAGFATFGYPFPLNATSTELLFNGGIALPNAGKIYFNGASDNNWTLSMDSTSDSYDWYMSGSPGTRYWNFINHDDQTAPMFAINGYTGFAYSRGAFDAGEPTTTSPYATLYAADGPYSPKLVAFAVASSTSSYATSTLFSISNTGTIQTSLGSGVVSSNGGTLYNSSTSTPTIGSVLTYSGTLGSFVGGTSGTFGIANSAITNAMLANSSLAITSPNSTLTLTSCNTVALGGTCQADINLATSNQWTAPTTFTKVVNMQNASTTLLTVQGTEWITPLGTPAGAFLAVDPNGKIISTTSPSGGAVSSVSNSDGTLTISPTTGAVVASLALGHANTWSALQTFSNSLISQASSTIGNGTQAGGLTISGGATTTGNIFVGTGSGARISLGVQGADESTIGIENYAGSALELNGGSGNNFLEYDGQNLYQAVQSVCCSLGLVTRQWSQGWIASLFASTTIQSTGNLIDYSAVGIGTTTPWATLSISTTTASSPLASLLAVASSTNATLFSVLGGGQPTLSEQLPATSTSIVLDWSKTARQLDYQIGTAGVTVTLINATTSQFAGSTKIVWICNPNATAGAITWVGVEWNGGTVPSQTTTANQCDSYSFDVSQGTSTSAYKVFGVQAAGFQ